MPPSNLTASTMSITSHGSSLNDSQSEVLASHDLENFKDLERKCMENYKPSLNRSTGLYCPRTFDKWLCWDETPAGTTAKKHCPDFIPGFFSTRFLDGGLFDEDEEPTDLNAQRKYAKGCRYGRECKEGKLEINDGNFITEKSFNICFKYLSTNDLKTCRLVCKRWNGLLQLHLKTKTYFVVYGDDDIKQEEGDTGRKLPSSYYKTRSVEECIKYLKVYTTRFSLWTELRLYYLKDYQLKMLLDTPECFQSAKCILELQLLFCDITWSSLLRVLKIFSKLTNFLDNQSFYTHKPPVTSPAKRFSDENKNAAESTTSRHNRKEVNRKKENNATKTPVIGSRTSVGTNVIPQNNKPGQVVNTPARINEKTDNRIDSEFIRNKDVYFENLKCLKIYKQGTGWNTSDLLKILSMTTIELEEVHLKCDPKHPEVTMKETFEFERNLNILLILNSDTLKKLYFDMMDQTDYFNDFLKVFNDWSVSIGHTNDKHVANLKSLILKFKYIWLSKGFENIILSILRNSGGLEQLGLGTIAYRSESIHLLHKIAQILPPRCTFEFGLFLTDHEKKDNQSSSPFHSKQVLKSQLIYRECMTDLVIGIFHDGVVSLLDILPDCCPDTVDVQKDKGNELKFVKTTDLAIFTNGWSRPNFKNFDIKLVTDLFVNVTKIEIVDGPWENYFEDNSGLLKKISQAEINDVDMQLILKKLLKLESLMIFANMENLTDFGMTGVSAAASKRMIGKNEFRLLSSKEIQGVSFSNLKNLQYLSLRGVGGKLTDVTVYWGFSNTHFLKTIIISHFPLWRRLSITMYEIGYFISVCALIVSLVIFCTFKCLECTRVRIHKHLFVSFIISNLLWLGWYRFVVNDPAVLLKNPWWCQAFHVLVQYFMVANYFWMFCEGFYLHTLIVLAYFQPESQLLKFFYFFGWAAPVIPIFFYVYFRATDEQDKTCWVEQSSWTHILSIPVCLCLVLPVSDTQHSLKKAVRATLILVPLLGLHYLVIPFRPDSGNKHLEYIYELVAAATSSLQGFCVSLLFCFCNSEVLNVIKRKCCSRLRREENSPVHQNNSCAPTSMSIVVMKRPSQQGSMNPSSPDTVDSYGYLNILD